MKLLKEEINIFFIALSFFTRVPFPKFAKFSQDYQHKSIKYFSLIGIIIGMFCGFVFFASNFIFPKIISIVLTYVAGVLFTGALHEDGFADVCDGFGGGWTKERILEIMKDSLVGVYGIVGLICLILVKISCYWTIDSTYLPLVIIASHAFSRFTATTIVNTHQYARVGNSKAKDMVKPISFISLFIAFIIAVVPILLFNNIYLFALIVLPYLSKIVLAGYFKKYIGGFTGDCIGSIQVLSEILFLLGYILYQNKLVDIIGELKILN